MNSVGKRIKERREELGYSQEELAYKLGYKDRSAISKMENTEVLTLKKVSAIAEVLKVTPAYLMGWEVETNNGTIVGHNSGTISNVGATTSHSGDSTNTDSNNTYTTNNYYSSPCEHRVNHQIEATIHSKELFFTIIDYLRDMTDEQLKDTIKYIEFLLKG